MSHLMLTGCGPGNGGVILPSLLPNLELWLDASTLSGSDGSTVTSWPDASGNARNAAAAGGSFGNAGTLLAAGINSRNAVRFNGSNQTMAATWQPTAAPVTLCAVFRLSGNITGDTKGVFTQDVSHVGGFSIQIDRAGSTNAGRVSCEYKASSFFMPVSFPIQSGGETIFVVVRASISGTTITQSIWVNGMQAHEFTYTRANGTPTNTKIGGYAASGLQCPCDVGEVFGYSRALSDAEIVSLSAYAASKWGTRSIGSRSYVQPHFHNSEEALYLSESNDTATWYPIPVKLTPSVGTVRDPSLIVRDGYQWVVYTSCGFSTGTSFGVAKAPVGSGVFTMVANVTCQVGATTQVWGPKWFFDENGDPRVIVNVSEGTVNAGPFKLYTIAPTNAGMTSWGTLTAITGTSLPSNMIDAMVFRNPSIANKWWILVKDEDTKKFITLRLDASSYANSGWVVDDSDIGYGDWIEGPSLMFEDAAPHKVMCDQYSASSPDGQVYMSYGAINDDLSLIGATPAAGWTPITHVGGITVRNGQARRRSQLETV